jgi:uncharacterized protein YecT (DUF1311 family)
MLSLAALLFAAMATPAAAQSADQLCDKAADASETGQRACLWREFGARKAELSVLESRILLALPAEAAPLKASAKQWARYVDTACDAATDLDNGGAGGVGAGPRCAEALTRERIRHLTETYMWAVEKREYGERYRVR